MVNETLNSSTTDGSMTDVADVTDFIDLDEDSYSHLPGDEQDRAYSESSGDNVSDLTGAPLVVLPIDARPCDVIYRLSQKIPLNEYGLPAYFYRSDLIHSWQQGLTQDDIDAAAVGLFYHDGYPVLESGTSFWNKLPHEPQDNYQLFQRFLEQAEELGIRQLDQLALDQNVELDTIQSISREFYWSSRARAHDLFITAAEARKRQFRIRKMENSHYDTAGSLIAPLMEKFEDPDWIQELTAKEAVEVLEKLVKIQRLSTGLTGQHASSNPRDALPAGASAEFIVRQLTRGTGASEAAQGNLTQKLQQLTANPEDFETLQEMILRVNTTDDQYKGRTHQSDAAFG